MSKKYLTEVIGEWEGYILGTTGRVDVNNGQKEVWLELFPDPNHTSICSNCGKPAKSIHQTVERWVRDLPILDSPTRLLVHRRRVHCQHCGPKLEQLSWLEPYARITTRLAKSVARLCHVLPIKQVAQWFDLDWKTVKRIDKHFLLKQLGPVDLSDISLLAMDEFAIHKGHRYATIVVEPYRKEVLYIGRGKDRTAVKGFFDLLGEEGCKRIKAVAMDMNGAFIEEVRARCPNAEVVYDLFHVVAKYGREVIDRVRVDEANRLRDDKKARKIVKGARWLLLRNPENVKAKDRIRLNDLLKVNRKLYRVYILKEDLKHLWDFKQPAAAKSFFNSWYSRAIRSRIEPLKKFAKNLKNYLNGILSHCRYPLHTSLLEGMNNKIKVIKRMAYGFHDDEYFFLKIRAAFHTNWR